MKHTAIENFPDSGLVIPGCERTGNGRAGLSSGLRFAAQFGSRFGLKFGLKFGRAQGGVAAVEFALVFPVVFLLVYGLITWALILLAQQTLTLAVGEGARAALRYSNAPVTAACSAVNGATTWLGTTACAASTPSTAACPYLSSQQCLTVTATYNYASSPLVPTLPFLNLVLPTTLTASTVVQLEPDVISQ